MVLFGYRIQAADQWQARGNSIPCSYIIVHIIYFILGFYFILYEYTVG